MAILFAAASRAGNCRVYFSSEETTRRSASVDTDLVNRWVEERLPDARPIDLCPGACWRCDAAQGETDVGLCPTCHHDLTAG